MGFLKKIVFLTFFLFTVSTTLAATVRGEEKNFSGCYNISNIDNFDAEKFMKGSWFEQQRTKNDFEGEICAQVTFEFTGDFRLRFNDEEWKYGTISRKNELKVQLDDNIYDIYVVATDYEQMAAIYSCYEGDDQIREHFWLLMREKRGNWHAWLEERPYLRDLLKNNQVCETPSTTPDHTSFEETEITTEENLTFSTPKSVIKGFRIPNSDKTFYFLAQFRTEDL